MISVLPIKRSLSLAIFFISFSFIAQENSMLQSSESGEVKAVNTKKDRRYFAAITTGYFQSFPNGDTYVGQVMEGNSGLDMKAHFYVFKQFFFGGAFGWQYLKVNEPELVGGYNKSNISYSYLYLGYEFLPFEHFRFGPNFGFGGTARYKNIVNSGGGKQIDTATIMRFGLCLDYEISKHFMVYLDYGYRVDKTNIATPLEVNDFFEKAKYHFLGFGVKIPIGNSDIVSMFMD